jgi:UDP-glucose 4-epimerase
MRGGEVVSGKRVLVTGGLGVNGASVVRELLARGHEPISLDARDDTSLVADVAAEFERRQGDVADVEGMARLLEEAALDSVIHLAIVLPAERDPFLGYRVNAFGTVAMLEAARRVGVERFVLGSSKAVFGPVTGSFAPPESAPLAEEGLPYALVPRMPVYSASKIFSEQVAAHYREAFGLSVLALRFATIFGPGKQARHGGIGILSAIVENALAGEGTVVPAAAQAQDDLVYVRDVATSLLDACFAPEPAAHWTFNIGSGRLTSISEFCETVREEIAPVEISLEPGDDYLGTGPVYAFMDISRARAELGYKPNFTVREGIRDYAAALLERQPG